MEVLYILMNSDLDSMKNCGKSVAQGSHATSLFENDACDFNDTYNQMYNEWKNEANGFGTTVVLSCSEYDLNKLEKSLDETEFPHNTVTDPTYPIIVSKEVANMIDTSLDSYPRKIKENSVVIYRSKKTCMYIFGDNENPELQDILKNYDLY